MPFIGKQPAVGSFTLLDSITTSATATYALTKNGDAFYPETARNLLVSLNGVTQAPEDAYTVSGSNVVFASALTSSDVIDYILVLGDVLDIGQPSDGTVGVPQMNSSLYSENEFFALPTGTTAQRPASPANGYTRFNTTIDQVEYYSATAGEWRVTSQQVLVASGGTEVTDGGYKYHIFKTSDTFSVASGGEIEYLIVAGGAGGGYGDVAGGGGAGGLLSGSATVGAGSFSVTVGAGGASTASYETLGANGANSVFNALIAVGGGGGGISTTSPSSGGSGGGGGYSSGGANSAGAAGTSGQGNAGGTAYTGGYNYGAGGGGGAGAAGSNGTTAIGGNGGAGLASTIITTALATAQSVGEVSGSSVYFAGGGGGATEYPSGSPGSASSGGVGGGGSGGTITINAGAGSANTGGGGGGSENTPGTANGNGGSGIVIIRYAI